MSRFLLALPMPCKYRRSSSVGDSLSPWISHSFHGPEQGSIFKSFLRSCWLWPKKTKTELLEFFHGGCLIHIGNLLFLMQPLPFFFFFHEKPHEGKGGPRKKFVTKSKGLGLTCDKIRSWKELKLTRGRWRERVCKRHRERARKRGSVRWVTCLHQLSGESLQKTPAQPTHLSWGAVGWTLYWPY